MSASHVWEEGPTNATCGVCGMVRKPAGMWLRKAAYWYKKDEWSWTRKEPPCVPTSPAGKEAVES